MICPTCGKEIEDGALVCEYCNQEFTYEEEATEVAEAEAVEEAVEEVAEEVEEVAGPSNVLAILSLVCGGLGILGFFPLIASIAGIILSVIYKKKGGKNVMGKVGLILSIVAIVLKVVGIILSIVAVVAVIVLSFLTTPGLLDEILWELGL